MLIAVGTGGVTSALSKGGSIARATSGAFIAFDAAGNNSSDVTDAQTQGTTNKTGLDFIDIATGG